eukprot:2310469-Prymnesium_polylepis.1
MGNSASIGASMQVADGKVSLTLAKKVADGKVSPASSSTGAGAGLPSFPCDYAMRVMRWAEFEKLGELVRSDVASKRRLTEELPAEGSSAAELSVIFISHSWWHRPPAGAAPAPDFVNGERKNLKYQVVCAGVRALIEREGLESSRVVLWCDWFSIDQDDPHRKAAGVRSMISYATRSTHMLIPLPGAHIVTAEYTDGDDPDDFAAYYPEDLAGYGERGWCRVEYFIFGLWSEMQPGAESYDLRLFAVSSVGELKHFRTVEFVGGERGDGCTSKVDANGCCMAG